MRRQPSKLRRWKSVCLKNFIMVFSSGKRVLLWVHWHHGQVDQWFLLSGKIDRRPILLWHYHFQVLLRSKGTRGHTRYFQVRVTS
jgi:hypothetical protein